jgi:cationic amino acid transporter 3
MCVYVCMYVCVCVCGGCPARCCTIDHRRYECPLVPFLPLAGVFFNVYLICNLNVWSYVRMVAWTCVGFAIYGFYGIKNSVLFTKRAPSAAMVHAADSTGASSYQKL